MLTENLTLKCCEGNNKKFISILTTCLIGTLHESNHTKQKRKIKKKTNLKFEIFNLRIY